MSQEEQSGRTLSNHLSCRRRDDQPASAAQLVELLGILQSVRADSVLGAGWKGKNT